MREITVITNLQVTTIFKDVPECFELNKNAYADALKEKLDADDVIVTSVQEFELEV